jgi:hypothetical protein
MKTKTIMKAVATGEGSYRTLVKKKAASYPRGLIAGVSSTRRTLTGSSSAMHIQQLSYTSRLP